MCIRDRYLAFEVDNDSLEGAVQGIRSLKLVGSNVSMPNKTVVHKYLDKLSPAAEMCGAVNTIVNKDGVLTGHITDGTGYMMSLKDNGVDAVSYTHLDVYKRQVQQRRLKKYLKRIIFLMKWTSIWERLFTCLLYTSRCV